ncbi:MAG: MoxR family ATPase [Nitrospirae bacterium]|nr:MoxR family ATPase [Nitrospirota bacterium]
MKQFEEAQNTIKKITDNMNIVMTGQSHSIRKVIAAFASGGHVLIEDFPGTGKTIFAKTFAKTINAVFKRIQLTPDLLPSDIIGISIFNPEERKFYFREGPIFTNILLADEINRASPRTQSALLECMGETQVTVDSKTYNLASPFFVIATQNPIEFHGTYPLPEALIDRFTLKFKLGYLSKESETDMITAQLEGHPFQTLSPSVTIDDVLNVREAVKMIHISAELRQYIVNITDATRHRKDIRLGAGPRCSIALMNVSRALALCDGLEFVTPDHIRELASAVISHRLILDQQSAFTGNSVEALVSDILKSISCPS